ncbi:PadR family transcriptional regulator [Leucobacter sp. CSA1]|uniref:PadR family transcriptional regulator n=1 Tax=Leucobacter chromiisoli TaxID=2796471 RepID=A0A934Q6T9_9MICO|nr:PadR family transcriptional regulator [Leucobacter chromiisoli]MBK0418435.1 PadR family transcriptional regulator [Leucobacter chromiisoli]
MSVKHAMLALLAAQPSSTYQLRKRFDASTGESWPLNIGQVSSTLQRLERDGLVVRGGEAAGAPAAASAGDEAGGQPWRLTEAGVGELAEWWARPVASAQRGRDELVVKFALAVVTPGVDIARLVQTQRAATQRAMHDLTRVRRDVEPDGLVARLILDHHLFAAEAELRWLDDVEASLARAHRAAATGSASGIADDGGAGAEDARGIVSDARAGTASKASGR